MERPHDMTAAGQQMNGEAGFPPPDGAGPPEALGPFEAVFEASPDAVCIAIDGEVARANASAATLLGYPSAEAMAGRARRSAKMPPIATAPAPM